MERIRRIAALALVAVVGLAGCGGAAPGGTPDQAQQAAMKEFQAERGGTAGAAEATGGNTQQQPVMGTVDRIDGNKIVVKSPIDGSTKTVRLAASTKIDKQTTGQLADIKPGEQVTAFGTKDGDTFAADSVMIGGIPGAGIMTFGAGELAGGNAAPGGNQVLVPGEGVAAAPDQVMRQAGGAADGAMPETLSGTVERVDGATFAVKGVDGTTTTVRLAEKGEIHKQVDAMIDDVKQGQIIMAVITWNGDVMEAQQIHILPAPTTT